MFSRWKRFLTGSLISWYDCTKSLLPLPPKKFLAQIRPNLAPNMHFCHFGPTIGIFGPFDPLPNQQTMRIRCPCGFSVMWVPKLLLPPVKIRILAQYRPNLAKNIYFWSFWSYWPIWYIWCHARPIKQWVRRALVVSLICVYRKFCSLTK